jgi:hypothetical protein
MIVNISFSFKYIGVNKMISTHECNFSSLIEKQAKKIISPIFYIKPLDELGIKFSKKLVVIGGFSGCFKTTLALNIVYNNAINMRFNCGFLSLEMDVDDILFKLLIRHAQHKKFFKYNCISRDLTIQKIYRNELTEEEKDFLFKIVEPDFKNNEFHGQIIVYGPEDYAELSGGLASLILKFEQKLLTLPLNKQPELDLLVIDYIQLLTRIINYERKDQFQAVADVVRYLKYLTQSYCDKRGISIIVLSQLNRTSYLAIKERLRNPRIMESDRYKGIYDLTAISESSEIVNAADIVLSIYTDDKLKKEKEAIIQLLKNRFGETIEEGKRILALPEFSYVGEFNPSDNNCPEYGEYFAKYIHGLIRGEIIV